MLLLKKHLVLRVRQGLKRQTVRLWKGQLLRAGVISHTPGLGKMRITAVDELASLDALTEADARADGFATRAALLAEIHKIYGRKLPPGRRIFRIKFEWPIDEAGRELVLAQRPAVTPAGRAEPRAEPRAERSRIVAQRASAKKSRTTRQATTAQRHALRQYIIAQSPRSERTTKH